MSKDKVQGFLLGLGAGVLVACFMKSPGEFEDGPPLRLPDVPTDRDTEDASKAAKA